MIFSEQALHERLQKALDKLEFTQTMPVQEATIPEVVNTDNRRRKNVRFLATLRKELFCLNG